MEETRYSPVEISAGRWRPPARNAGRQGMRYMTKKRQEKCKEKGHYYKHPAVYRQELLPDTVVRFLETGWDIEDAGQADKRRRMLMKIRKRDLEGMNLKGYLEQLETVDWGYFGTFTTAGMLSLPAARRAMTRYHKMVNRVMPCGMFWAAETFEMKRGYHVHALLNPDFRYFEPIKTEGYQLSLGRGGEGVKPKEPPAPFAAQKFVFLCNAWQWVTHHVKTPDGMSKSWNRVDMQLYDPKLGAAGYVTKYVTKKQADYDLLTPSIPEVDGEVFGVMR